MKFKIIILVIMLFSIIPINAIAHSSNYISLNSESVILIDGTTGEVLYEKYSDHPMYPASITKIVTAIIAIEQGNLNDKVTISENARNVAGTRVYLEKGEEVTLNKLVQGLMINSGNDAAVAIAEHISGSVDAFAEKMNQFIDQKIGANQTHFVNPHGLFNPKHITTAEDMAKITKYALKNPVFREIVSTKQLRWNGEAWDTILYNHHRLLRQREDVTGVKNGYVAPSGFTLVTSASRAHINLIVVTLNASTDDDAYEDTEKLLEYGFRNYKTNTIDAKKTYMDNEGEKYILDHEFHFTSAKNANWDTDVNNHGQLIIKGSNEKVIAKNQLSHLKTVQASTLSTAQTDLAKSQNNYWWLAAVLSLIGLLIFLYRRRKKKNRFFT